MKASERQCTAFHTFLHWQLDRLQEAIAEDRHYMGENQSRQISLQEAEKDFFDHAGYDCPARWRTEFCLHQCPNRNCCSLASRFIAEV